MVHWLMLVLLVGWGAYFVWALVRFREGAKPAPETSGRWALWTEIGVVVAEGVLLVAIALPIWFRQTSAALPVRRRWSCAWLPSNLPGTSTTRAPTASSAKP